MITSPRKAKTERRNPTFCDGHHSRRRRETGVSRARACHATGGRGGGRARLQAVQHQRPTALSVFGGFGIAPFLNRLHTNSMT
jgi:hypothetical protein